MSTGSGTSFLIDSEIEFLVKSICAPELFNFSITRISLSGLMPSIVMSPLVTTPATRYVPASILSAGISYEVPLSLSTPSIVI